MTGPEAISVTEVSLVTGPEGYLSVTEVGTEPGSAIWATGQLTGCDRGAALDRLTHIK